MAHVLAHAVVEAWRGVVRNRAFGGVVIAILALGAGSASALVGLTDALFVRPPAHVAESDRLVRVNRAGNYVFYQELARGSRALDVAAVSSRTLTLGHDETARPVRVECVTATYFDVLGVAPLAGRSFRPEEDTRGVEPTAVITYRLWQRHFNGRPDIVGDTTTISGRSHRIIGVAPPDFRGLGRHRADAWLLLPATPDLCSFLGVDLLDDPRGAWLTTIGRLRPGVPLADAEADVRSLLVGRLSGRLLARELEPAASSGVSMRDELLAISLAAGAILMLLIACGNVAGLLSTRALHRRQEIAVRAQLGASRARLFLQLFIENLMLTAVSLVAAWGVASAITSVLSAFFPQLARDTWFDPRSLVVLAAFTLGAGLVSGTVPALQAARAQKGGLWRTGQDVSHCRAYWRRALIVGQVALALLLVASAGLFTHSLLLVKRDLGYDIGNVVIAPLDLQQAGIARAEFRTAFDEMLARVRALPGVEAASLTGRSPDVTGQLVMALPSEEGAPRDSLPLIAHHVSPEYFRTLNTRILDGRSFTPEDRLGAPTVMIVDANLAREFWPGEAVVGRCKSMPRHAPCTTVIGISEPRRFGSLTRPDGEVFMPLAQHPSAVPQAVVARAHGDAEEIVPAVAAAIRSAVPSLAYANVQPLATFVDEGAVSWRLGATLFGLFGGLAIVLAAAGLYASLAFAVRQRTPEIGVRLALGANPASVARLVIGEGARLIALGWLLGTAAALYTAGWIRSLLFGVQPGDPATFALASLVIVLAGFAGLVLPALRAAKVDPAVALRAD